MTFFQGDSEIIIYLLLLSPLMSESCPVFARWFMKINAIHKGLTFKTTIPNTPLPSHSQLISSLFIMYICM